MKYAKLLFVICMMLTLFSPSFAQITIIMDDYNFTPGSEIQRGYQMWNMTPGPAGENLSWDFSALTANFYSTEQYDNPAGNHGAENFPTANLCARGDIVEGSQMLTYYFWNNTEIYPVGAVFHIEEPLTDIAVPITCNSPYYSFPLNYGDEWDYTTVTDFMGTVVTDSVHNVVDAWGTVTTATGTYECLRVFTHRTSTDDEGVETKYEYHWIAEGMGDVCYVQSEDDETEPDFTGGTYIFITQMGNWLSIKDLPGYQPEEYALNAAYPNPFNGQTRISYNLGNAGLTTLKVYDIQGRLITTLVNGPLNAGSHEVYFNANGLASGTYIVQLHSGNFHQTRRIQLIK